MEGFQLTRNECIDAAAAIVSGERYGTPESNFSDIAELWSVYLISTGIKGAVIHPRDVAAMMALLKIARIAAGTASADSWVDLAGYAACGCEIETGGNHDQD